MAATSDKIEFPALRDRRYLLHRIADVLEPYLRNDRGEDSSGSN